MQTTLTQEAVYLAGLADKIGRFPDEMGVGRHDAARLGKLVRRLLLIDRGGPGSYDRLLRVERIPSYEGGDTHLLVVEAGGYAVVIAVVLPHDGTAPLLMSGLFWSGAATACATSLLAMMKPEELDGHRADLIGFPSGSNDWLRNSLLKLMKACEDGRETGRPAIETMMGPCGKRSYHRWLLNLLDEFPIDPPPARGIATVHAVEPGPDLDAAMSALDAWATDLTRALRPSVIAWPDDYDWHPSLYVFYAVPGEAGTRRRQAAQAFPAFARYFTERPSIARAIDAGDPLLGILRDAFNGLERTDGLAPITHAQIRRMRAIASPVSDYWNIDLIARAVRATPLHLLPVTADGWEVFIRKGAEPIRELAGKGLDMSRFLCGYSRAWLVDPVPSPPSHTEDDALSNDTTGLKDFLTACSETLIPALGFGPFRRVGCGVAGRLLLRPFDLGEGFRRQAAWHGDRKRYLALVLARPLLTWPSLFPPFAHGNERILCLTTSHAIQDEGASDPDRDGIPGLSHCVGGYAPRCIAGLSAVASVRGLGSDGVMLRLSTIEFDLSGHAVKVAQHRGHSNTPPPPEACAALDALVGAIKDRTHPHSMPPRDPSRRSKEEPADPEIMLEAWAPFLPPRLARKGTDAIRKHLASDPGIALEFGD